MKILVVDDEALLVKGIKFNLENEGYTVVTGVDGVEAVDRAAAGDIDSRHAAASGSFRTFRSSCSRPRRAIWTSSWALSMERTTI